MFAVQAAFVAPIEAPSGQLAKEVASASIKWALHLGSSGDLRPALQFWQDFERQPAIKSQQLPLLSPVLLPCARHEVFV